MNLFMYRAPLGALKARLLIPLTNSCSSFSVFRSR